MPVRKFRPTSPGRRGASGHTFDEVTKKRPEKSLVVSKNRISGRSAGKISVRHRGGGAKRLIRIIDFKRDKIGVPGTVRAIEYDPGRSARIALVVYADGDKRYILAPDGLKVGAAIISADTGTIQVGNALPLSVIRLLISGCRMILTVWLLSRSSISAGVPAGARRPYHWLDS